jgi:hypothetical protein
VGNQVEVLFLQHPQEPDRTLGSAVLARLCLSQAQIAVGLSWANLSDAVGRRPIIAALFYENIRGGVWQAHSFCAH